MQMRAGDTPGHADLSDFSATLHALSFGDADAAQVVVHGYQSLTVVQKHGVTVEKIISDLDHGARSRCHDRRSRRCRDVETAVRLT